MATVLVVDDHPAMAGAVAAMLRSEGHDAAVVYDGRAALDAVGGGRPVDLIVLDVMMPGMSGLDVLRELRADPAPPTPPPPVIMFSGNDHFRDEAIRLGAVAFVSKVEAHRLLELVDEHARASGSPADARRAAPVPAKSHPR